MVMKQTYNFEYHVFYSEYDVLIACVNHYDIAKQDFIDLFSLHEFTEQCVCVCVFVALLSLT